MFLFFSYSYSYFLIQCFLNVVAANCNQASLNYSTEHMDSLFTETTDLLCNKWEEESTNCAKLAPLHLNRKAVKHSLTFVLPNLDIYTQT